MSKKPETTAFPFMGPARGESGQSSPCACLVYVDGLGKPTGRIRRERCVEHRELARAGSHTRGLK